MPCKILLVRGNLLYTDDPCSRLEFDDLINQQERIAMRKYSLDRYRIVNYLHTGHKVKSQESAEGANFNRLLTCSNRSGRNYFGVAVLAVPAGRAL